MESRGRVLTEERNKKNQLSLVIERLIQQPIFESLQCESLKYKYKLSLILPLHCFQSSRYMARGIGERRSWKWTQGAWLGQLLSSGAIYRNRAQRDEGNNGFGLEHPFFKVPIK